MVWLKNRAEIRLFDKRLGVIDVQDYCDSLDNLYGPIVSATTMKYLQFNRGKRDGSKVVMEGQGSSTVQLVKEIIMLNRLTGMGITQVCLPGNPNGDGTYVVEVQNPIVKKAEGAAGMFLLAYWAGALTALVGKKLEIKTINYDRSRDVMVGELATKTIVREIGE
jgi:hypothetical protein